jgi:2'-5' RNA ligase
MEVDTIKETLRELHHRPILIDFDLPLRFSGGSGVLIPSKQKNPEFDNLRKALLSKWTGEPRSHQAHITLIHPRNSKCTDEIFAEISRLEFPNRILFNSISLIEQEDNKPWVVLEEYQLVD